MFPDDGIRWRAGDSFSNTVEQSGKDPDVTTWYLLADVGLDQQQDAAEWFRDYEGGSHRYVQHANTLRPELLSTNVRTSAMGVRPCPVRDRRSTTDSYLQ